MPDPQIHNPHDRLVKRAFGDAAVAAGLFGENLTPELTRGLDLARLRVIPGSFVDENLRETHSDLLYAAPIEGGGEALLYLLFEHATAVERLEALDLAGYLLEIVKKHKVKLPDAGGWSIPPAVAVLVHQGGPWTAPRRLSELVTGVDWDSGFGEALRGRILDFQYDVIELPVDDFRRIRGHIVGRVVLGVMQAASQNRVFDYFRDYGDLIEELLCQDGAVGILETLLRYSVDVDDRLETGDFRTLAQMVPNPESKEKLMTLAQKLVEEGRQEGRQEGWRDGREDGRREGQATILVSMLENRFGPGARRLAERIAKLPTPALEALGIRILSLADLAELTDWLAEQETD